MNELGPMQTGRSRMDLQVWDTPFGDALLPSVALILDTHGDSTVTAVVAPGGIDEYPKYLVRFSAVYAFNCEEEAGGTAYDGAFVGRQQHHVGCSYIWRDSPLAAGYAPSVPDMAFRGGQTPVVHYVLLGGDNAVGIVTAELPTIEKIEGARQLCLTYDV